MDTDRRSHATGFRDQLNTAHAPRQCCPHRPLLSLLRALHGQLLRGFTPIPFGSERQSTGGRLSLFLGRRDCEKCRDEQPPQKFLRWSPSSSHFRGVIFPPAGFMIQHIPGTYLATAVPPLATFKQKDSLFCRPWLDRLVGQVVNKAGGRVLVLWKNMRRTGSTQRAQAPGAKKEKCVPTGDTEVRWTECELRALCLEGGRGVCAGAPLQNATLTFLRHHS